MYQQFAVTMAVSVIISAFNALTLSPALGALLLRPKKEGRGPLARFFRAFNSGFGKATDVYGRVCGSLIRKIFISLLLILLLGLAGGGIGAKMPSDSSPRKIKDISTESCSYREHPRSSKRMRFPGKLRTSF